MKALYKGKFWWPNIAKDLERTYKTCEACKEESISKMQKKAAVTPDDLTMLAPGEEISLDFASMGTKKYLIIKDRMTGYLEAKQTKNQKVAEAIKYTHEFIYTYGLPHKVRSDG